jgi:cell shape-determining protein MreD
MKFLLNKIASILAFVIGAMAVFAGGRVLLGILPDYYVIDWLPIYNFTLGVISVLFSSFVIWKNNKLAMPAAIGTFSLHAVVMLILQTAYREVVAPESIVAMTVRLAIWILIVILLIVQQRNKQMNARGRLTHQNLSVRAGE